MLIPVDFLVKSYSSYL